MKTYEMQDEATIRLDLVKDLKDARHIYPLTYYTRVQHKYTAKFTMFKIYEKMLNNTSQ